MKAERWNKKYKVGQVVELTNDFGHKEITSTRSIAWDLGHGVPVVSVKGRSGGYSLNRIKAI